MIPSPTPFAPAANRQLVERWLREAGRRGDGPLTLAWIPAPVAPLVAVARAIGEPPTVAWRDPSGFGCVGFGVSAVVTATGPERFEEVERAVRAELDHLTSFAFTEGAPRARMFGGFAFGPGAAARAGWSEFGDARLVLPRITYVTSDGVGWWGLARRGDEPLLDWDVAAERLGALEPLARAESAPPEARFAAVPPDDDLMRCLRSACAAVDRGELGKVVVAHRQRLRAELAPDVITVLSRLIAENPSATCFAFRVGECCFLGATPERLIARHRSSVVAEALAGSASRGAASDPGSLLVSDKDLTEHGFVVRDVAARLAPLCASLDVPLRPVLRELRDVVHLLTPITGKLSRDVNVIRLVERLHPTPAVGGTPTASALAWLDEHEPVPRGWYAAPVGWVDGSGDGDFVVALRSGLLSAEGAELWAGAGVVAGSDPVAEAGEIRLKLGTFLSALGAGGP